MTQYIWNDHEWEMVPPSCMWCKDPIEPDGKSPVFPICDPCRHIFYERSTDAWEYEQ